MEDATSGEQEARKAETSRGVTRWLIREVMGVVLVALSLFIAAGRWDWFWGWALAAIYAAWTTASALILIPRDPELLAERATRSEGMKSWDTVILSIIGLLTLAKHITAGLDYRLHWTPPMPVVLQAAALLVAALGYALMTWAMVTNSFFSLVVRVQEERGHAVVSSGPYRFVRHPGYVGTIAFELLTPILLGSLWALIPGVLAALLTIVRTALEDKALLGELDGYGDYAERVRYRLVPGIW